MNTSASAHRLEADELDAMHRVAHGIYQQGHYEDAGRYFWFMWLNAPTDLRYLKGFGACLFMARAYEPAAIAYALLVNMTPTDAEANCMYGHTLLMLGDREAAKRFLQRSLQLPGADDIQMRARALIDLISR